MTTKKWLQIGLITLIFFGSGALIVSAFLEQQLIFFAAAALILCALIITKKWPLLLPLAVSLGVLVLLYSSSSWPLELEQRQILGAVLGANAGYGLAYCWLKLFTAQTTQ